MNTTRLDTLFVFDHQTGRLSLPAAGWAGGCIHFSAGPFNVSSDGLAWSKTADGYFAEFAECRLLVNSCGDTIQAGIVNGGPKPVLLNEIVIRFDPSSAAAPMPAEDYHEFILNTFVGSSGVKKVGLNNRWMDHNPESLLVYVLKALRTGRCVLLGATPDHRGDYTTFKALHDSPHLQGYFGVAIRSRQQRSIPPGAKAWMTPVRAAVGDDPLALLEEHGELFRQARKRPLRPVCAGWNSWDYFSGAVSADDMFSNLRAARKSFGNKIKYLVIDEGWEPRWGDWVANWKFPAGLKDFCRKVRAAKMTPGIWTAPTMVNRYTRLYRDNPEWFARDAAGQVARENCSYGPMSYLDITHPEARQWVSETFRRLRAEGFEYFKVDFTQRVLQAEQFHDATVPRGQIIRMLFETIRQAIGNDAYLLACGAPFQSVTGLADASRVSGDIHNFWSHVLLNVCDISAAWWMHRRCWNNDPDFVIARSRDTATSWHLNAVRPMEPFVYRPVWMNGREMDLEEIRCYLLLLYLSAGEMMLGDDLPGLKDNALAMLRRILHRPLRDAARPLDLFSTHAGLPSRFLAKEKDRAVLGLFNWEEDPATFPVNLKELGLTGMPRVRDFWTNEPVPFHKGRLVVELQPHRSTGLVFSA